MGLGSFFKSSAGALGQLAGGALGGPLGSVIGGSIGGSIEQGFRDKQQRQRLTDERNFQREFAQNSIQWRAADAKKAGVHPLAALGASTHSPSPP